MSVIKSERYDMVDGRNAYSSSIKKITIGKPFFDDNKSMEVAAQIWREDEVGNLVVYYEVPIHQIFDLMIILSRTILHFKEAYRFEKLYDDSVIDRIGVQGGAINLEIDEDNENLDVEIRELSQSLNNLGEITGERLRVLSRLIEELGMY